MEPNQPRGIDRWFMVGVVFSTWIFSAGVNYAFVQARIEAMAQRQDRIEQVQKDYIPRPEYDTTREDVANRLGRIERKIDDLR